MQHDIDLEALLVELQAELRRRGGGLNGCLTPDEIEDAVQEATAELLEMIRNDEVHTSLKALAHLVVRRRCCREIERQQRQRGLMERYAHHLRPLLDSPVDPAAVAENKDAEDRLWRAFQQLDDLERVTVGLRFYGGYSYQAIAEVLGFDDEQAVNVCLRRARRQLKRLLKGGAL